MLCLFEKKRALGMALGSVRSLALYQACELCRLSTPTLNKSNVTAAAVTRVVCTVFSAVPLGVYFWVFFGQKG